MGEDCAMLGLPVQKLPAGTVDGGDILVTDREILVGVSARTSPEGFDQLSAIARTGVTRSACCAPRTGASLQIRLQRIGRIPSWQSPAFPATPASPITKCSEFRQVKQAAADSIRVNDTVLVPAGYRRPRN